MDFRELSKMRVIDLRELAKEKTSLTGVSGLHKDELIDKLAEELGIEKPHKVAELSDKASIKKHLHELKSQRLDALASKDKDKLIATRKELKKIRRKLQHAAKEAMRHQA